MLPRTLILFDDLFFCHFMAWSVNQIFGNIPLCIVSVLLYNIILDIEVPIQKELDFILICYYFALSLTDTYNEIQNSCYLVN